MAIRFLAEAHRLRMLEGGAEKLTTVQALIMINIIYNSMGKDRIGSEYLPPAISMAINLDIFSPSSKENGTIHDGEERLVRAVTAWGLYDWQRYSYHRDPIHSR